MGFVWSLGETCEGTCMSWSVGCLCLVFYFIQNIENVHMEALELLKDTFDGAELCHKGIKVLKHCVDYQFLSVL